MKRWGGHVDTSVVLLAHDASLCVLRKLLPSPVGPYVVPLSNFERSSIYLFTIGVRYWVPLEHLIGTLMSVHPNSSTSIKIKLISAESRI